MKNITIFGKEYSIEYTVEVQSKFAEKSGGLDKIGDIFDNNFPFTLATMMDAAQKRLKFEGKEGGDTLTEKEISDITAILTPFELNTIKREAINVINSACKADVEVAEEKGQKGKKLTKSE